MLMKTLPALAAASALFLSACATTAWQPAPGHPAEPGATQGSIAPVTAIERYRSWMRKSDAAPGTQPLPDPHDAEPAPTPSRQHHHGSEGEEGQ